MAAKSFTLLAIDDNADNLTALGALVTEVFPEAHYVTARDGVEGIELALKEQPSVILLDILMPGMDGYQVCQRLRQEEALRHIPVIFLSALRSDAENRGRALDVGGDGFLTKPVDPIELTAQVRAMLKMYANARTLQHDRDTLEKMVNERTRALQHELVERRAAEERLKEALDKVTTSQNALLNILEDLKTENEARVQSESALRESQRQLSTLIANLPGIAYRCANDGDWTMQFISQGCLALTGYTPQQLVGNAELSFNEIIHPDDRKMIWDEIQASLAKRQSYQLTYRIITVTGEARWVWEQGQGVFNEKGEVEALEGLITDISDRKAAEAQAQRQLETITALYEAATSLASDLDLAGLAQQVTRRSVETFGVKLARLGFEDAREGLIPLAYFHLGGTKDAQVELWRKPGFGETPSARSRRLAEPVVIEDLQAGDVPENWRQAAREGGYTTSASIPLISRGRAVGSMSLYSDQPGFFSPERVNFFLAYARIAAVALENANLLYDANTRLQRVQALRNIDTAINANFDLNVTFNILLEETTKQLGVDAADIMLFDNGTYSLKYAAGAGFEKTKFPNYTLKPGEGLPGQAVTTQRTVYLKEFTHILHPGEQKLLETEGFKNYCCTPMMVKGKLAGVLEVFHRSEIRFNDEFANFLELLAAQAATAVENARLFTDLERSNMDLRLAYDATIEGWSRAMDLRDKETEGHTQRVTTITVRMARAFGMRDEEIAQARRGALLHDIGKMGVPDHVLLKPGKLTPEERVLIEKHPVYAKEMLEPIQYLRDALDIPYCHHERWDGSGYPQGLKGEQIPLAARIFAVIDVWDALVSDRPYRAAWPPKKVVAYIQENAGTLFDPKVVQVFLGIVNELKDVG